MNKIEKRIGKNNLMGVYQNPRTTVAAYLFVNANWTLGIAIRRYMQQGWQLYLFPPEAQDDFDYFLERMEIKDNSWEEIQKAKRFVPYGPQAVCKASHSEGTMIQSKT